MNIESKRPSVKCKVFKDNNGAIELSKAPKIRPRTKHISLKYHHFTEHILESSDWNKSDWHSGTSNEHIHKSLAVSNLQLSKEKDDGLEQTVIYLDEWGSVR